MIFKSVFTLMLISSVSLAQTKTVPKPQPKPVATPAPKTLLETSKAFAEAEVKRLQKELDVAADNPKLLPCDFYSMKVQLKYNEWFLEPAHYAEFEKLSASVEEKFSIINSKLGELENATVNVLVGEAQGASSSEAPVALKDLVKFFRLYDQRMQSCPKDQRAALQEMMESEPLGNRMHMVLSQMQAAGGMMSVNLNASLKEADASYELVMKPRSCGYDLDLQVTSMLNGKAEVHRFSLLGGDLQSSKVRLGEDAKWEMLSRAKIDGMSVDGLLRYREFQNQFKGKCKDSVSIPSIPSGRPYVKPLDISTILSSLRVKGIDWGSDLVEFVTIEPGTFMMGSPVDEANRYGDEDLHQVTLTKSFEMQITEVNQAQWYSIMKANPSYFKLEAYCPTTWREGMCPDHPVENVSWDDVQVFIQKLNALEDGYVYRLPSEAEWEYAARGGVVGPYFNGTEENLKSVAWYSASSGGQTYSVAQRGANAFGLYDVHGNVWEWTQDLWVDHLSQDETDPLKSGSGGKKVMRGGSWNSDSRALRLAFRGAGDHDHASSEIGFRLVRTLK